MSSRWTEETCTTAIATYIAEHGFLPTRREMDGHQDLPPGHALRRIWGSTPAALRAMGYEPWPPGLRRSPDLYWTTERIIESVRAWIAKHDDIPTSADFSSATDLPPSGCIQKRFGSQRALWRAIGVVPPRVGARRGFPTKQERKGGRNRQMVTAGMRDANGVHHAAIGDRPGHIVAR